ncbi:hypothetical protein LIPSTDRAFT_76438 [Lipomyces starkeyi NRRL Y-11557]|uniref:FAD-dependent oxidoreductase 2 FAD-binding domain-containing protein n=1 Tax=Lipomyces starkeyi NRRL Y-11557 TaxID=675824 RepID=A0A1E3PV32_LIPST|nr:hypothetical protein LIPSTDRAFT_76438 [Lipomyces starkeyi NRRL Y-11557]
MTGHELANDIGCGKDKLKKVLENYNDTAAGKRKDPYGKKYFHNLPLDINDNNFHVALVTQVLHFTVGGAEITDRAQVLHARSKEPFDGLYACGELAGGVHGANRLGGSSLLGCVVYRRVRTCSWRLGIAMFVPESPQTRCLNGEQASPHNLISHRPIQPRPFCR